MSSKNGKKSKVLTTQNSRYVSLAPTGQQTFTQNSKAIFEIDESLGYIKGRDSYLVAEVLNTSADKSRWSFPNGVGASALIEKVDIYSLRTGQLLETLNNWNQWVGIEMQYLRDDYESMSLLEGVAIPVKQYENILDPASRNIVQLDPSSIENNQISPMLADQITSNYLARRFTIPLKSGVLGRWWDDERVCPVLNLGGLRIEITFAPYSHVCKRLGFKSQLPGDASTLKNAVFGLGVNGGAGIKIKGNAANFGNNANPLQTDQANVYGYFTTNLGNLGLAIGMRVRVSAIVNATGANQFAPTVRTIVNITDSATVGSKSVELDDNTDFPAGALTNIILYVDDTQQNSSYEVQSLELRVLQMAMPKEAMDKLGKPMIYEFTSYNHFLNTLPASSLSHQVPINSVATKAKAIFSNFVSTYDENDPEKMGYYSADGPTELNLVSQQLFMNNKLYPLNKINPQALQDKVIVQNELVKAFSAINRVPLNLGSNKGGDLQDYTNTYLYSRELARGDYVQDISNAEPEIRLEFSTARAYNRKINTFCFSRKVINITPQGLMVLQ